MDTDWVTKNVGHHGWPARKKLKTTLAKTPSKKQSKKRNFDQKINDSKPHIWSLSSNFRFSRKKSQS